VGEKEAREEGLGFGGLRRVLGSAGGAAAGRGAGVLPDDRHSPHRPNCVVMEPASRRKSYYSVFDAEVLKRELDRIGIKALHVFTIWT
jgi:hypothetical protein